MIFQWRADDKSRYIAINEFSACFFIRLPSLFSYLNHSLSLTALGSDLPFFTQHMVTITHEHNIACSKTHLDSTRERTIICTQLFTGHEVGSWPISEKEGQNASNDNRKHWHNNNQKTPNDELYIKTHLKYFSRPRTTMVIIFPG